MKVLIVDDRVAQYPYSFARLRKDNPGVSFPKKPSAELLAKWGVLPVVEVVEPTPAETEIVDEVDPVLFGQDWTQQYVIRNKTQGELDEDAANITAKFAEPQMRFNRRMQNYVRAARVPPQDPLTPAQFAAWWRNNVES